MDLATLKDGLDEWGRLSRCDFRIKKRRYAQWVRVQIPWLLTKLIT